MLDHGYVREYVEDADKSILNGQLDGLWEPGPSMVVHPDVGKWLIALGEKAFGMDPFGWRIAAAVVGALMVLVMCRFVRRVTGSTALGLRRRAAAVAGRPAPRAVPAGAARHLPRLLHPVRGPLRRRGPPVVPGAAGRRVPTRRLFRPWLLAGGIAFGLAVGTKWTALFPLAAFGADGLRVELGRAALLRPPPGAAARRVPRRGAGLPAPGGGRAVVYVATWTGWLVHAAEYEEALSNTQYTTYDGGTQWPTATEADAEGVGEVVQSLRSLWYYHQDVYTFHAHFLNDSEHVYASKPAGWLLMSRPVGVDAQLDIQPGSQGCDAPEGSTCLRQVLLLGNPLIWWGGALALLFAVVRWVGARDWRFGVAVVGTGSTWLPWLMYDDRPIFIFYAIACLPFVVLALTLALGTLVGRSDEPSPRRTAGVVVAGSYVVLVLLAFAWFWPIWTDQLITHSEWLDRVWFTRWI